MKARKSVSMSLSTSDLSFEDKKKKKEKEQLYREFLGECYTKIKERNKLKVYSFIHTVPLITLGKPLYNMEELMNYIIEKLTQGGFKVKPLRINSIFIDWSHSKS